MEAWREIPARPDPPDPAQPGALKRGEPTGAWRTRRPNRHAAARPSRGSLARRPSRGADPGLAGSKHQRPSREPGAEAQPGSEGATSPGGNRPSRHSGSAGEHAGPLGKKE
jgi:hypothetical protein